MTVNPLIRGLAAAAVVGLLAAILVPNYIRARTSASVNTCVDRNLPAIAAAKRLWAVANGKAVGTTPEPKDLLAYFEGAHAPRCSMNEGSPC